MNTLDKFIKSAYEKWKDRPYLHQKCGDSEVTETFGSFIEKAESLSAYLINKGFYGKKIGIFSPNSIGLMIIDIAVMNHVGVSVGFSKDWKYDDIIYGLKNCDVFCLFYSEIYDDIIEKVKNEIPNLKLICIERELDNCIEQGRGFSDIPTKTDDEPAKIVFTSGSTSFPKAVLLSLTNIFFGYNEVHKRVPLGENDICYLFLPLHHTYGLIYNFIYSFVFGYQIYLAENIKNMAQEMLACKPTAFAAVPLVYTKFYEASKSLCIPIKTLLGGQLKYLFCGGAKLSNELKQAYLNENMYLLNAYALSETASAFSIAYPSDIEYDCVGTVFDGIDVKIVSPDENGFGELAVKGKNVFLGYFNNEQATKSAFDDDGYFLTGDIGTVKDGRVYLNGRKDTMITLSNGENVSSSALSRKIKSAHNDISNVKIYVRNDSLMADVYLSSDSSNTDEIRKAVENLNDSLPKYERITDFKILSSSVLLK